MWYHKRIKSTAKGALVSHMSVKAGQEKGAHFLYLQGFRDLLFVDRIPFLPDQYAVPALAR